MANEILHHSYYVQWGQESVHGTGVAATSKVLGGPGMTFRTAGEISRPNMQGGVLLQNTGHEHAVSRGTTWSLDPTPAAVEQLPNWLSMAVDGEPAPSGITDPKTWTYTRNATAIPAPDSFTFETFDTDGSTDIEHEYNYALVSDITISGAAGQGVLVAANGFARRVQDTTVTPGLAYPATINGFPTTANTRLESAATFAATFTTVSGQLVDFSYNFITGFQPKMYADARTDLDFGNHIFNPEIVNHTLDMTLTVTPTTHNTLKAAAEAQTRLFYRIWSRAAEFDAPDTGIFYAIVIDGVYVVADETLLEWGNSDGIRTIALNLTGASEVTTPTNFMQIAVINERATMN